MKRSKLHEKGRLKKRPPCGTPAGYEGHLRRSEWPCGRCLFGSRTYTNEEIRKLVEDQYNSDRDQQLWSTYRLSLERFEAIFKQQGARCGCCGTTSPGDATWHVDHDHETTQIRGVLCPKCNNGIGQLGDNLDGLFQAVAYLQAYHARGGHALADSPPPSRQKDPPISALMQRCFEFFQQGLSKKDLVLVLRLEPAFVGELHDIWRDKFREIMPSPPDQHVFQIARDPFRCMCSCGFTMTCDEKDSETVLAATETVNGHIKDSRARKGDWQVLKSEEDARRTQEEQREKEAERLRALEDIRQREAQRTKELERQQRDEQRKERGYHQGTMHRWKGYGKD